MPSTSRPRFYCSRDVAPLVAEGVSLLGQCGFILMQPIVGAVLLQVVGIVIALTLPFSIIDWVSTHPDAVHSPVWWGVFLVSIVPGMGLFMWSFWRYVVWISALNLVVRDCVEIGYCPDPDIYWMRVAQRTVDYSLVWLFLFALGFIPVGLGVLIVALADAVHLSSFIGVSLGVAVAGVTGLVALGVALACSLVFQVFAFTPGTAGAALFRSVDLVKLAPGKTVLLLLLVGFLTQGLIPALGLGVFDILGLSTRLGQVIMPWVQHVLEVNQASWQASGLLTSQGVHAFGMLISHAQALCVEIIRTTVMSIISALTLPLATVWMALWYGSLKDQQDQAEAALRQRPPMRAV